MKRMTNKIISILLTILLSIIILPITNNYINADDPETVNVTFNTNGGTPIDPVSVSYNGTVSRPADPEKTGLTLKYWVDKNGNEFDFDTKLTEDIELKAKWKAVLTLNIYDLSTGEASKGGSVVCDKGKQVDPPTVGTVVYEVDEGEQIMISATPDDNRGFVGWSTDNTRDNVECNTLNWGFHLFGHTTLFALFDDLVTYTIHFSSLDGVDVLEDGTKVDPIKIAVAKGTTLEDALFKNGYFFYDTIFEKDDYSSSGFYAPKPISEYDNYDDLEDEAYRPDYEIEADTDIYYVMLKNINEVDITVEEPKCGTVISAKDPGGVTYAIDNQNPIPEVKINGQHYILDTNDEEVGAIWVVDQDNDLFVGTMEGDQEYYAEIWLIPDYGYDFDVTKDASTVNNASIIRAYELGDWQFYLVKVKAIHEYDEPLIHWDVNNNATASIICKGNPNHIKDEEKGIVTSKITKEATCEDWGNTTYTASFTRFDFGELNSITLENIEPIGHDYDEGTITKEPTCEEKGIKTYICKHDNNHIKIEEIDALGHDYGEDLIHWDINNNATATRICKRDSSHIDEEKGIVTSNITKEATCEGYGETTYIATFTRFDFGEYNSITLEDIEPIGHDYGDWIIVKEATESEEGLKERICKHDPNHKENMIIPKLDPNEIYSNTEGNNSIWYSGDNNNLSFTFKRSNEDETTLSHFTYADVDGNRLTNDDCDIRSGSIIIDLKPSYLNKLSIGKHIITAHFNDGNNASAIFEIKDNPKPIIPDTSVK